MSVAPLPQTGDQTTPQHIAIIMDGNGRWATARGKNRTAGHRAGAEAVRRTVEAAVAQGVRFLTLYSFSSENWSRPESEIKDLMGLLRLYLNKEVSLLMKHGVRLKVIGDRARLADDIVDAIQKAEKKTADNAGMTLILALSYGGRDEILRATRDLAQRCHDGELRVEDIDQSTFETALYTNDIPDPDLLIRTSGEKRLSNFLLWQIAYAEFVFLEKHWPDFDASDLSDAISEYTRRERRYGTSTA